MSKYYVHHLHNKDLPNYMFVLAYRHRLSGKAHHELLEQEIKMHMKLMFSIRGLEKQQVEAFIDMLCYMQTSTRNRYNATLSTF